MGKINWSATALNDIESIGDYIAHDSPFQAVLFVDRMIQKTEILEKFPMIGRKVPEFDREEIRELLFQNYRIIYKLHKKDVFIVSVTHGRMDMLKKADREEWEL